MASLFQVRTQGSFPYLPQVTQLQFESGWAQAPPPRGPTSSTGPSGAESAARTLYPSPELPFSVPYCPWVSGPQVLPKLLSQAFGRTREAHLPKH